MNLFKHLANVLAMPLAVALLFGALGYLCRVRGWRCTGISLFIVAVLLAYLGSLDPVGQWLLAPLESRYRPLDPAALSVPVNYIVVLGASYEPSRGVPASAALNDDGLKRIVEAIVLMRRLSTRWLVVSGGALPGQAPSARGYAELARELGVADASIVTSDVSLDTGGEAHAVQKLLGSAPYILVTSAYHMPRAIWLMTRLGTRPVPAPSGQRVSNDYHFSWRSFVPDGTGLANSERALHEYIGLAALQAGLE